MAYSKISNKTQDKDVKYISKDYNSFKNKLIEFTKSYFPNNFNDFSEGNPGMMFLEMAAYVGNVLSFYTDTQLRESILTSAQNKENLYNIAYTLGYKPKVTSAASVDLDISQLVPSLGASDDYEPDYNFALNINANSTFTSTEGPTFYTTKDARFGFSSSFEPTEISIYQYDGSNNPEYYLLSKKVTAVSGERKTKTFQISQGTRFNTLILFDFDIISIDSITDLEGNTCCPEIAPPIARSVDRDSGTFGVETYNYGNVEIASEVGWDNYKRVADGLMTILNKTGLLHGYSFNSWSDVVTYDNAFVEEWLDSPQTSLYYSLQVMGDTQDKSDAYAALEDAEADAYLEEILAPQCECGE